MGAIRCGLVVDDCNPLHTLGQIMETIPKWGLSLVIRAVGVEFLWHLLKRIATHKEVNVLLQIACPGFGMVSSTCCRRSSEFCLASSHPERADAKQEIQP